MKRVIDSNIIFHAARRRTDAHCTQHSPTATVQI